MAKTERRRRRFGVYVKHLGQLPALVGTYDDEGHAVTGARLHAAISGRGWWRVVDRVADAEVFSIEMGTTTRSRG